MLRVWIPASRVEFSNRAQRRVTNCCPASLPAAPRPAGRYGNPETIPGSTQPPTLGVGTLDNVRAVFWSSYRHLFPPHSIAAQSPNGSLVISWSITDDPHATYPYAAPVVLRFEPALLEAMAKADARVRLRIAANHEPTLRELLSAHRSSPLCSSCHSRMDPLGLAFENFNAMGMWRDERGVNLLDSGAHFYDTYETKDGKYVLDGNAYDVANRRDLTETSRAKARKDALAKVGPDKRIVFAPAAPLAAKHTVTVFTDVDCPFCRRFHQQIAAYNAKGIAVDYLFYPLSIHPGADKKAEAVWCSQDRPNAFTAAMSGKDPGKATCPNPVGELTELAKSLGIGGTPTVLADDGSQIPSQIAMSPDRLAAELDRLADASAAKN